MSTTNSFAEVTSSWQKLLAACADNAAVLTMAEPQRLALEKMLKDALDLKSLQESHRGAKQEIRQQLTLAVKEGREAARRLQGAVKANVGTSNERLVQFNIKPIRPRGARKKVAPAPQVPTPQVPAPPAVGTPQTHLAGQADETK
jgi:hypothetical protein